MGIGVAILSGVGRAALWSLNTVATAAASIAANEKWEEHKAKENEEAEKKKELQNNLMRQGANLIQTNPELSKMSKQLDKFDKKGQLSDPFHRESTDVERKFKQKLETLMEPEIYNEAGKLGLKYQAPLTSVFRK